jgi:hypothetical protein
MREFFKGWKRKLRGGTLVREVNLASLQCAAQRTLLSSVVRVISVGNLI